MSAACVTNARARRCAHNMSVACLLLSHDYNRDHPTKYQTLSSVHKIFLSSPTCQSGLSVKASWSPRQTHTPEMEESSSFPKRHTDEKACLRILSRRWNIPAGPTEEPLYSTDMHPLVIVLCKWLNISINQTVFGIHFSSFYSTLSARDQLTRRELGKWLSNTISVSVLGELFDNG